MRWVTFWATFGATFWAIFSQTHLVTLPKLLGMIVARKHSNIAKELLMKLFFAYIHTNAIVCSQSESKSSTFWRKTQFAES
jgi:hypothetical protein